MKVSKRRERLEPAGPALPLEPGASISYEVMSILKVIGASPTVGPRLYIDTRGHVGVWLSSTVRGRTCIVATDRPGLTGGYIGIKSNSRFLDPPVDYQSDYLRKPWLWSTRLCVSPVACAAHIF